MLTEVLDWHTLGTKLGLPVYKLGEIRIDHIAYGTVCQRQKMITTWLEYDTKASWDKLANALKEMGKHIAANKIHRTYTPGYGGEFANDLHCNLSLHLSLIPITCRCTARTKDQEKLTLYYVLMDAAAADKK